MSKEKELRVNREQYYDEDKKLWMDKFVNVKRIKTAAVQAGSHPGTQMYRKDIGAGTALRITRLEFGMRGGTPAGAMGMFYMQDRDGTFGYPTLEADGERILMGNLENPVTIVKGTFEVGLGSCTGGSHFFAFEGYLHQKGTETVSA